MNYTPEQIAQAQLEFVRNIKQITNRVQDKDTTPTNITFADPDIAARFMVSVCLHVLAEHFQSWANLDAWLNATADAALDALNNIEEEQ